MPSEIVAPHARAEPAIAQLFAEPIECGACARKARPVADDADVVPHDALELRAQRAEIARLLPKRMKRPLPHLIEGVAVDRHMVEPGGEVARHCAPSNAAKDGGIGNPIAAQAVGAMDTARILARRIKAEQRRPALDVEDNPAHHVMRRRHHLDQPARKIKAAISAARDHAGELPGNVLGPEVRHRQIDPAMGACAAGAHLLEDGTRDDVARGTLGPGIIGAHETRPGAVEKMSARAPQPLLKHRARHAGLGPRQKPRRVELHHLHVTQREPRAQGHSEPIA